MSRTSNDPETRRDSDDYPTPTWCVAQLSRHVLPGLGLKSGDRVLEPSAGAGNIIHTLSLVEGLDYEWTAVETNPEHVARLGLLQVEMSSRGRPLMHVAGGDFAEIAGHWIDSGQRFEAVIMNPPFHAAQEFLEICCGLAPVVVMFGRVDFPGSRSRNPFMVEHPPDMNVLVPRPRCVNGRADSGESAWMVWFTRERRGAGTFRVLPEWPKDAMVGGQDLL